MRNTILTITTAVALAAAIPAAGQTTGDWTLEIRGNGAMPTRDLGADPLDTGLGLEATVRYRLLPHLAAYAGWDWLRFRADRSFAGEDMDFEETGYVLGLRFQHPIAGSGVDGWVRAGSTYDHLEVEDPDGDIIADSGHGLGWEVGAGVATALRGRWSVTPGIRYRSLSRDIEIDGLATPVDLRYVAFEIGVARTF